MVRTRQILFLVSLPLSLLSPGVTPSTVTAQAANGPTISPIRVITPGPIEKFAKFEIAFDIRDTTATNMFLPYEGDTPPGVEDGTGITVDARLLPPGRSDWDHAKTLPCFFYQPVEQVGTGEAAGLLPVGEPEWRCRFTPEVPGNWQYKVQAKDAGGTRESPIGSFTSVDADRQGFVRVSATDPRFFEFSDGTPFFYPLVNLEEGSPFNGLARLRESVRSLGENGVRFVRWFPTGEGANFFIVPFDDDLRMTWGFGASGTAIDETDSGTDHRFSFSPYFYSGQRIPALPGASYRMTVRAKITGDQVLRAEINDTWLDICSKASGFHESNGEGDRCDHKADGWGDYSFTFVNTRNDASLYVWIHGLYVSSDAPSPYNNVKSGSIDLNSIQLQRDETGNGVWGPNLISRGDPDTYRYVDQIDAAELDELFRLSEQYGVYHKLTLFHKNSEILNTFQADGTLGDWKGYNDNFYSADGQASRWYQRAYVRYFIARWSYSPALHSLELANENHLTDLSYEAGFSLAEYVHKTSPRHILMSNSFWGWFVEKFWVDPERGNLLDYADKHWYANETGSACNDGGDFCDLISNTWTDSAAYVRECWDRFQDYKRWWDYDKPIVRGEGGVASSGTGPQHPELSSDAPGGSHEHKVVYYQKKLWAHIGSLGFTCDGEWYPRFFVDSGVDEKADIWNVYRAYERFMKGEPLSNGSFVEIGTDLEGEYQIPKSGNMAGALRAWGVRSTALGRVLLWVDNANHTWRNVRRNVSIAPVGGTLTVQGLPPGNYAAEWWDTRQGTVTKAETYTVGEDGALTFALSDLTTDLAVKFVNDAFAPTFVDVPPTHPYYPAIEALYQAGYTVGCETNPLRYCPDRALTRAESAVFVERGIHGVDVNPNQPTEERFADLGLDSWAVKWADALYLDGFTAGCGTDPLSFCPWQGHTRAEGAVFYLRMLHGADYLPPQPQGIFADVDPSAWHAKWDEAAYNASLIPACSPPGEPLRFCPDDPLTRGLAAYMMVQAKGLTSP